MKGFKFLVLFFTLSISLFAQEDSFFFEDDFYEEEGSNSIMAFSYGGSTGFNVDYIDETWNTNANLDVDFTAESSSLDLVANFDIKLNNIDNLADFPLQNNVYETSAYVDTLYLRYYNTYFDMELGYLKPIWGNADGIHAIDVLNPLDYSNPFGTTYLESKISQQMLKFNIPVGSDSLIEIVYLPTFKGDHIPLSGTWVPTYLANIEDTIRDMAYGTAIAAAAAGNPTLTYDQLLAAVASDVDMQLAAFDYELRFDESEYFTDSQVALRYTTTLNSMDIGLTYYYGFLRQPTIDLDDVMESLALNLVYNRVQTIGFDIAAQVGSFNLKGEVGYNLTEDIKGDDSGINNNSLKYVLGFDINLPLNNINLLIQGVGTTILNSSEIEMMDSGYSADNEYTTISFMGRLSDNYLNETLYVEITGAYYLFDNDFMVKPKATYNFGDNTQFYVEYLLLEGEETTTFGQYNGNDTLKIGFDYTF